MITTRGPTLAGMASDFSAPPHQLIGLPGAGHVGTGPVVEPLLDDLLSDVVPAVPSVPGAASEVGAGAVAQALAEHRDHHAAWYGDLVGPLRVPASATVSLLGSLRPGDHALPIVLTPDPASDDLLAALRAARALLLDNHRVELVGVELPFAAADNAADAARRALNALDFTVPAWFMVKAEPGWEPAFDVLAQDGAERVALYLPSPTGPQTFADIAAVLRALIDRELPYAITDGIAGLVTTTTGHGLLNLLCATRAALNGAETPPMAAILAETRIAPLAAAARRMSDADAAIVRSFLPMVSGPSIRDLVQDLESEGLIEPDAA
jgi:hypothetical protein